MKIDLSKLKQSFIDAFVMEFAPDIIRGFLLGILEPVKPEHIKEVIDKWETNLWKFVPDNIRNNAMVFVKRYGKYAYLINVKLVLLWLKTDRPDLYEAIVKHERGVEWLKECIENIKKSIFV